MKTCPNCNYEVNDTAKFCKKCGFNIKKYEEESQNATMFCEECGAKIDSDSDFCEECGFKFVNEEKKETLKQELSFDLGAIDGISMTAEAQLYEQNGLRVENGVLVAYTGKRRSVTVPGTIEEIYDGVFKNNNVIIDVEIEEGVKTIGKKAFANCFSLEEIYIPKSCKRIFNDSFEGTKIKTLVLSEMNEKTISIFLSDNVQKSLRAEDYAEFVSNKDNRVYVNIRGIEEKVIRELEEKRKTELEKWKVGKTQIFGSYFKDGASALFYALELYVSDEDEAKDLISNRFEYMDPMEWIVLARDGNKALLISKYTMRKSSYNDFAAKYTWECCSLRDSLNNSFFEDAFTDKEKEKILSTKIIDGEKEITDKVFILSSDEAYEYFETSDKRATQLLPKFQNEKGHVYKNDESCWWLRDSIENQGCSAYVNEKGKIEEIECEYFNDDMGTRPAIWVDVDKIIAEM